MVANWRELTPGDTVVLIARNKDCIEGTIDAVTKDGAFLWLRQEGFRPRCVFYHSDGYKASWTRGRHKPRRGPQSYCYRGVKTTWNSNP
ncbi:hypothetical protein GCM10017710_25900 [Arthrobacter ramosus]